MSLLRRMDQELGCFQTPLFLTTPLRVQIQIKSGAHAAKVVEVVTTDKDAATVADDRS